jgi:uncharacterized caspase-like protein
MTRRELLLAIAAAAVVPGRRVRTQALGDTAGAARDLVNQALELLSSKATTVDVSSAARFLRSALDQEPTFGDAHYYRQLCLKRLNQDAQTQRRHLESAELYESEALRDRRDPFTLAVPKIFGDLASVGQKWALVVGVSQFQPDIGAERLQSAAADAESIAALLRDPSVGRFPTNQVFLLTNQDATTANIKARLNTIARNAKPEDVVVTYISTHGSARADDLKKVSYLYTYDTNVTSRDQVFGTALPMVEVSGIISNRCVAQRTVAIFDTCHSGSGLESRALSSDDIDRLREGAGRYIISSCEPEQKSYEDAGHGYFTASLIEQLSTRKGCVRLKDLFANVQRDVAGRVKQRLQKDQRPVMASSADASEIVLGAAPGGASEGCLS